MYLTSYQLDGNDSFDNVQQSTALEGILFASKHNVFMMQVT